MYIPCDIARGIPSSNKGNFKMSNVVSFVMNLDVITVELQWLEHLMDHGNFFLDMGSSSH